ncbi:hypothetical protein [Roseomonas chloroacetimidivorans]|uniref:hypothetical protein n=1 Tax=Roseomonas chloroacetimidivorans TaxID=1766656 RepID=UPI003C737186
MKAQNSPLLGYWRIIEADLWDQEYLNLVGPAHLIIRHDAPGEIAFGAMQASLDAAFGIDNTDFTWIGADEGDEVQGSGYAELLPNGSLQIELEYQGGDEATLIAVRQTSSAAC